MPDLVHRCAARPSPFLSVRKTRRARTPADDSTHPSIRPSILIKFEPRTNGSELMFPVSFAFVRNFLRKRTHSDSSSYCKLCAMATNGGRRMNSDAPANLLHIEQHFLVIRKDVSCVPFCRGHVKAILAPCIAFSNGSRSIAALVLNEFGLSFLRLAIVLATVWTEPKWFSVFICSLVCRQVHESCFSLPAWQQIAAAGLPSKPTGAPCKLSIALGSKAEELD